MSQKALERVQKLIALALGGASEEEGRTAAVMAVRLIQQHGLLSAASAAPPPPKPRHDYASWAHNTPPRPPPEKWNGPIKSKWEKGRCEVCRQEVMKGNVVVWLGKRVRHETCHKLYSPKT